MIDMICFECVKAGGRALAEALKVNKTVTDIDVWGNPLGGSEPHITAAVENNARASKQ
jgi:hypothetical protein